MPVPIVVTAPLIAGEVCPVAGLTRPAACAALLARIASLALSLLPSGTPKAFDIVAETVIPSLYGPKPVVAEAGAAAFGAEDTAVAAGEGLTAAAVDPVDTDFVPAGVATETVFDLVGGAAAGAEAFGADDTAAAPGPSLTAAAEEPAETLLVPAGVETLTVPVDLAGAEDFGAEDTAAAAGAAFTEAAEDVAETLLVPAGVATLTVLLAAAGAAALAAAGAAALAGAAAFEEVPLSPPPPPPPSPPNTGRFMKRSSSRMYMLYPPMLGKTPFRRPRCASTFWCSPYSALKNLRRWRHTNNTSLGPPGTIRSTKTRHSPSSLLKISAPS